MTVEMQKILPLPPDVVAQIKSSCSITSLIGTILGLIHNSLDAKCQKIEVTADFPRGACTVEDDGRGIQPAEFLEEGGLGKVYCQSRSAYSAILIVALIVGRYLKIRE